MKRRDMEASSSVNGEQTVQSSSTTTQKIILLVRKNLLLRRRHYIMTICEVLLPALFSFLMSYSRTKYGHHGEQSFRRVFEEELIQNFTNANPGYPWQDKCASSDKTFTILFSPNGPACDHFMQRLNERLNNSTKGIFGIDVLGFGCELELEQFYQDKSLSHDFQVKAAVVFKEKCDFTNGQNYTIRFPNGVIEYQDKLFPPDAKLEKSWRGPTLENEKRYSGTGFSGLQIFIEKYIVEEMTGQKFDDLNYSIMAFPYPEFDSMDLSQFYVTFLPQFVAQSSIFVVPSIIRTIVSEKESGIKELMKVMGLPSKIQWIGWAINSAVVSFATVVLIVIVYSISYTINPDIAVEFIEPTLWAFVLLLYAISATTLCFFITTFFERSILATGVGILIWLLSYYAVTFGVPHGRYYVISMLLVFFPNVGLFYAMEIRSRFEVSDGADWSDFFKTPSGIFLSFGAICIMWLLSSLMYTFLIFYFDNVIPTSYSVTKPWNYIFQCKACRLTKSKTRRRVESLNYFELGHPQKRCLKKFQHNPPLNLPPGIELNNISKVFSSSKLAAVQNITMTMYQGHITVLVGNNGAGKSTTISILAGMIKPSRGRAKVNGFDISEQMDEIRKNMGYCPQHNLLFDDLTVQEHLIFFAKVKGRSNADALTETNFYMRKLQLTFKRNTFAKSLSGGQKRKLSLACALVGDNKVLILDEPTSGLDPKARRAVWDLLLDKRESTTIFITTHFLEEADILGDRVGIICNGRLKCFGSPWFLKKSFGGGYSLTVSTLNNRNKFVSQILERVQKHIPRAQKMKQYVTGSFELKINLPMRDHSERLPALFADITAHKLELGIQAIGISPTTLEEVFLHGESDPISKLDGMVKQMLAPPILIQIISVDHLFWSPLLIFRVVDTSQHQGFLDAEIHCDIFKPQQDHYCQKQKSPCRNIASEFWVLFSKRFVAATRRQFILFCQLAMPALIMATGIIITRDIYQEGESPKLLNINFDIGKYDHPKILYSTNESNIAENIRNQPNTGIFVAIEPSENITHMLIEIAKTDWYSFRRNYLVAVNITRTNEDGLEALGMFSTIPYHASPLVVNLLSNAIIGGNMSNPLHYPRIHLSVLPLVATLDSIQEGVKIFGREAVSVSQVPIMFAGFISLGLGVLVASFLVLPSDERQSRIKDIQLMTGVHPAVYWASFFTCDLILSVISIALMLATVPILERGQTLRANDGLGHLFIISVTFVLGAIPFTYLISLIVGSIPIGFALIATVHLTAGLAFNVFVSFLDAVDHAARTVNIVHWLARLFPTYGCVRSILMYVSIGATNMRCRILSSSGELKRMCESSAYSNDSCCETCSSGSYINCEPLTDFMVWQNSTGAPGIQQELVYMVFMAVIHCGILLLAESRPWNSMSLYFLKYFSKWRNAGNDSLEHDRNLTGFDRNALIATDLSKSYGKLTSVSKLSFGITQGECFGLMGINGAGKSTLIRLLTGNETLNRGNVCLYQQEGPLSQALSLNDNRTKFLERIGYCPQSEGLIEILTGEEHLNLICTLRNILSGHIHKEVNKWLDLTGLNSARNIQVVNYSGGMRRKLSIALAFIGDPPIIILDEPTSGVDALAKRQFWSVVAEATKNGQTVLITSHSLEEYEALCSHIGILVDGSLKCFGKIGEVKLKYSQGFGLTVRTKHLFASDEALQEQLNRKIMKSFHPDIILKGSRQNILEYQVNINSMCWSTFFKIMEGIRRKYLLFLDDYSVKETSLEQVLLAFSGQNEPDFSTNIPKVHAVVNES